MRNLIKKILRESSGVEWIQDIPDGIPANTLSNGWYILTSDSGEKFYITNVINRNGRLDIKYNYRDPNGRLHGGGMYLKSLIDLYNNDMAGLFDKNDREINPNYITP